MGVAFSMLIESGTSKTTLFPILTPVTRNEVIVRTRISCRHYIPDDEGTSAQPLCRTGQKLGATVGYGCFVFNNQLTKLFHGTKDMSTNVTT